MLPIRKFQTAGAFSRRQAISHDADMLAVGFRYPPESKKLNFQGAPRHVGVEIEFAAVEVAAAAKLVQSLLGGEITSIDPYLFQVHGTELGDFQCELDFQYAHKVADARDKDKPFLGDVEDALRQAIGDVGSLLAPCEIVCPPVEISQLPRIDELRDALRQAGAEGTGEGLLHAFGAQLNPEIASKSDDYIVSVLKAYMLLSEWLRQEIKVDPTRWLLAFADPFPQAYLELTLASDYWPDIDTFIDNHLAYNATRNRELDLLPLFCWLSESKVRAAIDDPRIKPRPTFHYRLPNAQMQDTGWSIATEWNRWCHVEYLANDRDGLDEACEAWLENTQKLLPEPWAEQVKPWLM